MKTYGALRGGDAPRLAPPRGAMKLMRAGTIYAIANVASAAVPFVLLPLLTRVLGPEQYGHVISFALLVTFCMTVSGLNAHAALGVAWFTRPLDEIPSLSAMAVLLAAASTAVIAPFVALVLWLIPWLGAGVNPAWGATAALTAGANVVVQCRLVLWQSQQRPIQSAVLQISGSVLNVGLSLWAVLVFGLGGAGRNAGIAIASILMACTVVGLMQVSKELRWTVRWDHIKTLVLFGLPLILHTLAAVFLSTADRWMISIQLGPRELGVYGAGAQLGSVMAILADAFVKAYGPWLYAKLASDDPEDKQCAVGAVYAAMPTFLCAAGIIGIGLQFASSVVLGPAYRAAAGVLPWFMLGGAFSGMYLCTSVLYFFSGRTSLLASVTTSAAIVSATATWLLVSTLGVRGAAIGYATTQCVLALFTTVMALRSFDLPWRGPRKALAVWSQRVFSSFNA